MLRKDLSYCGRPSTAKVRNFASLSRVGKRSVNRPRVTITLCLLDPNKQTSVSAATRFARDWRRLGAAHSAESVRADA
jgi:hypothetical protein